MQTERTEALAEHRAAEAITYLLTDHRRTGEAMDDYDAEHTAKAVVGHYSVQEERRDGLRRVVLYGPWEVDPAAARAGAPAAPAMTHTGA